MTIIDGLSAVADRYELFLVDQWGVLHDGESPHDGAVETLKALRAAGWSGVPNQCRAMSWQLYHTPRLEPKTTV